MQKRVHCKRSEEILNSEVCAEVGADLEKAWVARYRHHKTFVRASQKSDSCYSAVCYRNVGITTVTFLASANKSLV